MINMTCAKIQLFKLQTQLLEVSCADPYIYKAMCFNFGLNPIRVTTDVPSDIDPATSHLQTKRQFVTLISCDLEPDTNMTTFQKIFVFAGLDPYIFNTESSV